MATPITQMPKPDAGQYSGERKLFLVPSFMMPPTLPEDGLALLDAYWSEVRDHVASLSRSLGQVSRVYHEMVYDGGDAGIEMIEQIEKEDPSGRMKGAGIKISDSILTYMSGSLAGGQLGSLAASARMRVRSSRLS